jgi:RNA polymerase sigma factor (sigma-70 family)
MSHLTTESATPVDRAGDSAGLLADGATVGELVAGARRGDAAAWDALVRRYAALVVAVTRAFRLPAGNAEDVSRMVWLRLTEHLDRIREPRAVPRWILTTARDESQRAGAALRRTAAADPLAGSPAPALPDPAELDADLLRAERSQALRDGLAELPAAQRRMLLLVVAEPPLSHDQIGRALGIPVGSVGPMRDRCLQRLRATPAMRQVAGDHPHGAPAGQR